MHSFKVFDFSTENQVNEKVLDVSVIGHGKLPDLTEEQEIEVSTL